MGNANLNPWTEAKVNTKNPDRGPLLIIDGEKDSAVGDRERRLQAAEAQPRRDGDREDAEPRPLPPIDHGWREVAQTALDFGKRFA
jgi:non-heme chloroperoxidase